MQPVVTATPNSDGDTYHTVLYGQSLFAIATWYGVTVGKIKELNSLTSDAIYEGQKLLISVKPTAYHHPYPYCHGSSTHAYAYLHQGTANSRANDHSHTYSKAERWQHVGEN